MKILMLTTSFPLYQGHPAGVFVFEQARHLCRAGMDVHVLAPGQTGGKRFESMGEIAVSRFSYFWPKNKMRLCYGDGIPENMKKDPRLRLQMPFLAFMFLVHAIRLARRFDVIYAHWTLAGLAAIVAGKLFRKPVVVMIHHGQERYDVNPLEKFVINHADQVICNSRYTMGRLTRFYRPRHCHIISPGVDIDVFKPQRINPSDDFFHNLGICDHLPVVLALGRHIQWKGFANLVRAAALIKERIPFMLVVAGLGPETPNLKALTETLGLQEQVVFTGRISNHDLPRLYNRADVFVLPSIVDNRGNTEGLGVVLMEAMACGTPCVASNVGGIPDIVQDGYNGFLVPAGDVAALAESVSSLLLDSSLCKELGENGQRFIRETYSWSRLTERTVVLLAELTAPE